MKTKLKRIRIPTPRQLELIKANTAARLELNAAKTVEDYNNAFAKLSSTWKEYATEIGARV